MKKNYNIKALERVLSYYIAIFILILSDFQTSIICFCLCPMMDRIDLHIEVPSVNFNDISGTSTGESSASIKKRINKARRVQLERYEAEGIYFNSQLKPKQMTVYCSIGKKEKELLRNAFDRFNLSARAYNRILKVARTIADLEGCEDIKLDHIAEAIQHRSLDRKYSL